MTIPASTAEVVVIGINDTPHDWSGEVRYGLFTLAGAYLQDEIRAVRLPANAATPLAPINRELWERMGRSQAGTFALLAREGACVAQHRLLRARFKDVSFVAPVIEVSRQDESVVFRADTFVWGVCLDIDGDAGLADNVFDLLPGIPYAIPWPRAAADPQIVRIGSRDILRYPG